MNKLVSFNSDLKSLSWEMSRSGFGEALLAGGQANKNVMALCADLTDSIKISAFAKAFPEQYLEMGVAEQNMMGVAAGLALSGKIPFVASYAVFNPGRNWDQMRVSVAYSKANVKIIGAHAGISVGPDGATHQALEDIAITRVLPNVVVIVPTDIEETRKAVAAAIAHNGPVYIRFGREKVASLTSKETPFVIGKANLLQIGSDVTICANGSLVYEALLAAEELAKHKIQAEVLVVHTVKPLDAEAILASVRKTGAIVTAEEAQVIGGLGSAVAELIGEHFPVPLKRIGVQDSFGESGKPEELMDKYRMRSIDIMKAVQEVIGRKQ